MRTFLIASLVFVLAISAGCAGRFPAETETVREKVDPVAGECSRIAALGSDAEATHESSIPGWKLASSIDTYDRETLFDYIDGAAEIYFAYDFRAVAAAEYQSLGFAEHEDSDLAHGESVNTRGENSIMVDVYDMTTPGNAFGIYSLSRYPEANYVNIGNEGILTGTNLDFWKGRYFCKVYSFDMSEKYQNDVINFGKALASKIQEAGEEPSVLRRLPQNGLISRSARFFSRKLGMDNIRYVSEENVFNLNAGTKGVIAEYQMDNARFQLFIIEYPSLDEALSAFEMYSKYLEGEAELLSTNETSEMFGVDDKIAFIGIKDQSLWGFWDVGGLETAESILQNISPFPR